MRRGDLTKEKRAEIGYEAYKAQNSKNSYGRIVEIAKEYEVCRAFVYILLNIFKSCLVEAYFVKEVKKVICKRELIARMTFLRMISHNSIKAISEIMRYDKFGYSSTGTISENLSKIGNALPKIQNIPLDKKIKITAVADEIFIGNQPILITLDPISSAILSIELAKERSKEVWVKHIEEIEVEGKIEIISMVTDEGKGLCSAITKKNISWNPDSYHAVAHRLGSWANRLEAQAYKRIDIEYERKHIILSAKTPKVINQRRYKYGKACKESIKAIEMYDDFCYFYSYIIKEMQPFHSDGKLRDKVEAKQNIEIALEFIESLRNELINKQIASIRRILSELLNYFDEAKEAIKRCKNLGIEDETITTLVLVWKWNKALIKAKKRQRIKKAREEYLLYFEYAKDDLGDRFENLKTAVFNELDQIIQASSMVENINSILRPYLNNSKNQINQEFLNLFAFYHNHRRYGDGKRKGKTPMEIITKKRQEKDWITLLMNYIEEVEPKLFL
jgi:hypothetical protein